MRLPPTKIEEIRKILTDAGLYHERNEKLIRDAVEMEVLIERARREIGNHTLMLRTLGSNNQEKVSVNPIVTEYRRMIHDHAMILAKLGLGNSPGADSAQNGKLLDNIMTL